MAEEAGRRVVRVEAVVATIEIKSDLRAGDMRDMFARLNKGLIQLKRFYEPTDQLLSLMHVQQLGRDRGEAKNSRAEQLLRDGIGAMSHHESIPEVVSFGFGFSGCSIDNVAEFQLPGVDVVCILGKYTAAKQPVGFSSNPAEMAHFADGEDALCAFLFLIEDCLEKFMESQRRVSPSWRRYFMLPVRLAATTPP